LRENKTFTIVIGEQRSGKSFLCNKILSAYIGRGGSGLVYNLGLLDDFQAAAPGYIVSLNDTELMQPDKQSLQAFRNRPQAKYYEDAKGNRRNIRDFCPENAGRAVKVPRADRATERAFFNEVFLSFANCLLIIDDCRPLFRYGVNDEWLQLLFRRDHAGRDCPAKNWQGAGVDIVFIFHSLDQVNNELLDANPKIITFQYKQTPDFAKVDNPYLRGGLERMHEVLKDKPRYSYAVFDPDTAETKLYDAGKNKFFLIK